MNSNYTLAYLIHPQTIEDFFQKYWESKYLYISRNNERYYSKILNDGDIDLFLQNKRLHPSYISLVKDGIELSFDEWTTIQSQGRASRIKDQFRIVDNDRLFGLLNQGSTLLIVSGDQIIPKLINFCDALESELKFQLQANIYITPPKAQGLLPHYDDHDVLILPITGTKLWRLYSSPIKLPSRNRRFQKKVESLGAPELQVELNAGDLLYIPRGVIHEAHTTGTTSIHITLGFHPNYWFDLLQEIIDLSQNNPIFRRSIPHGFTNDDQKNAFKEEFRRLSRTLIENLDIDNLLERKFDHFVSERRSNNQNRFNDLIQKNGLNINSILSKRNNLIFKLENDGRDMYLNFCQKSLKFPIFLKAALDTILWSERFSVKDINGLINDKGKIHLATQLIQEGFLTIEETNAKI